MNHLSLWHNPDQLNYNTNEETKLFTYKNNTFQTEKLLRTLHTLTSFTCSELRNNNKGNIFYRFRILVQYKIYQLKRFITITVAKYFSWKNRPEISLQKNFQSSKCVVFVNTLAIYIRPWMTLNALQSK